MTGSGPTRLPAAQAGTPLPVPPPGAGLQVARVLSLLLHPFAVVGVLVLAAAGRLDPDALPRAMAGVAVVVAVVWGYSLQRWRSGHWSTVDASQPRERPVLYALALVLAGGWWLWMGGNRSPLSQGVLAVVAMLCVAGLANRWIKLSLHMACLAFAGVALLVLARPLAVGLLLALPALGWSRLRLGRHRPVEVVGGTSLGALAGMSLLF